MTHDWIETAVWLVLGIIIGWLLMEVTKKK